MVMILAHDFLKLYSFQYYFHYIIQPNNLKTYLGVFHLLYFYNFKIT